MKIILSTGNPSKAEQIKAILTGLPVSISTLAEVGIKGEAVEDGKTLQANSLIKAQFARDHDTTGAWTVADDTGFFIDALDGQPGIYAARWAGDVSTEEITQFTLKKLEGFPDLTDRTARFETLVALISPDSKHYFFSGQVDGHILNKPRCAPQPMMPYSGIFVPNESNKVWAQMSVEEENRISHRGKAFRKARVFIEELLQKK